MFPVCVSVPVCRSVSALTAEPLNMQTQNSLQELILTISHICKFGRSRS